MVRIREDARNCSLLLGWPVAADPLAITPEGSGFIIAHAEHAYIVTAAHVAETLTGGPFSIRIGLSNGQNRVEEISKPNWHFHADKSVDVALMQFNPPTGAVAMPSTEFVDDYKAKDWEIGPGDAAYVVGLFHLHAGRSRNLPVVHAGHIALMPSDEKIPVKKRGGRGVEEVSAYLVEAHALPGASGSAVLIRPTIRFLAKEVEDSQETIAITQARDFLLGVWVAAWPGKPTASLKKALGISSETWIPVGMGLVIPAQRLIDILESKDVVEERQNTTMTHEWTRGATLTGALNSRSPKADENPRHKEDFTSLLDAATRGNKPTGQT